MSQYFGMHTSREKNRMESLYTWCMENGRYELLNEWDAEENKGISLQTVSSGSGKVVSWSCNLGHKWKSRVIDRKRGRGCPYCNNQKIMPGYNDLATKRPDIAKEWDYKRNTGLSPNMLFTHSNIKAWWICPKGHSYEMNINSRTNNAKSGCPICKNKKALEGYNDLKTLYPLIAKEWHPTKNGDLKPENVTFGSNTKVWWLGKCGHEYEQKICYRTNSNGGCPYCSRQKFMKGVNDLATTNPELLDIWDYEKNTILPSETSVGKHNKLWWKCKYGHSFQDYASNLREDKVHRCPVCTKEHRSSFPEQAVFYYIKKYFPDSKNGERKAIDDELDIYIPHIKTAVEYDGYRWHRENNYEIIKNLKCITKDIRLIRIREKGLSYYDTCECIMLKSNKEYALECAIKDLIKRLVNENCKIDINIKRDRTEILSSYAATIKEKSLGSEYPHIAAEWHPTKNREITPEMIKPKSNKKMWWLCPKGHEYCMRVADKVRGKGCPFCNTNTVLVVGYNDLQTCYPELLKEWDFTRNKSSPTNYIGGKYSEKKVWWICESCGTKYLARIGSKVQGKICCPTCQKSHNVHNKKVMCVETAIIYNSLQEAGNAAGCKYQSISKACRTKGTCKGYHWELM